MKQILFVVVVTMGLMVCLTSVDGAEKKPEKAEAKAEMIYSIRPIKEHAINPNGALEIINFPDGRQLTCVQMYSGYHGGSSISCNWEEFNKQRPLAK